jgi:hypothetical protein
MATIDKPVTLDLLDGQGAPALSSTSDIPVVETKPDATNEEAPPEQEAEAPAAAPEGEKPEGAEQPGESATPATEEQSGEPAKKESRGVQKALDRLTAEREEHRRRADAAEERLERALDVLEKLTGQPAAAEETRAADTEPAKPVREKYADAAAWERALLDYSDEKAAWVARKEVRAAMAEHAAKTQATSDHSTLQTAHKARMDKAREKYADFAEYAERSDISVALPVVAAILHSENGAELQYYLGKNPAEAQRLNKLPPPMQILELGKLEAKLTAKPEAKPNVSAAPKPINPSRPAAEGVRKPPEDESMEEYAARRQKEIRSSMRH